MAAATDPGALGILLPVAAALAGFAVGALARPLLDRLGASARDTAGRRRASQVEVLQELQDLLPALQRASETMRDPGGEQRLVELNLQVVIARDRVASRRLRGRIAQYQQEVMNLVAFQREEWERPPLADEDGAVSGPQALSRVQAALLARRDTWTGLAGALSGISEELGGRPGRRA